MSPKDKRPAAASRSSPWERQPLTLDDGSVVAAIAPVILSVSRATDVPAFFGSWFVGRLAAGSLTWTNRFNNRLSPVALANVRVIVFWTKNPAPFLQHLSAVDAAGINYYFQYTLNNYVPEGLEPALPPLNERIDTFRRLSGRVGPERVIWRFDPLVASPSLDAGRLLDRIDSIAASVAGFTKKLVVSFVDLRAYPFAARRMGERYREWRDEEIMALARGLSSIARSRRLAVATCAEPAELDDLGIAHNACIDGDLMLRIFGNDERLVRFIGGLGGRPKDRGQRRWCRCIPSKDVGAYNTCANGCRYCYANNAVA